MRRTVVPYEWPDPAMFIEFPAVHGLHHFYLPYEWPDPAMFIEFPAVHGLHHFYLPKAA
jgi:hypothetical protein